jgi:hypothetical protein
MSQKTMIENSLWPANQIERWPIDRLVPYARNARTHTDAQIAQIAASIREWGWTIPVLVAEDGTILAGHARALAALKFGITEIPVIVARGWSEAKRRAYVIADNKLTLNSGWDEELLRIELADLKLEEFPLELLGFEIVRWQDFTGEQAMLEGRTFAEVRGARCDPNCDMAEGVAIASEAVPPREGCMADERASR